MRIKYLFPLMASLILILSSTLKGDEFVTGPSYVEQIQQIAEEMEVFPIDLIAREGPLSYFKKGARYPVVSRRVELKQDSFKKFYDFCQLAFDATLDDIEDCLDYLPQASPKEKALILAILYIYAYPWEKQKHITDSNELIEALKTRSWASLQFSVGAFDLAVRKNSRQLTKQDKERLLRVIALCQEEDEIAFQSIEITPVARPTDDEIRIAREVCEIIDSLDCKEGISPNDGSLSFLCREAVIERIRLEYPDSASKIISDLLYVSYPNDFMEAYDTGLLPTEGNASEKPKTVGQIAQELIESWNPPLLSDDQQSFLKKVFEKSDFSNPK